LENAEVSVFPTVVAQIPGFEGVLPPQMPILGGRFALPRSVVRGIIAQPEGVRADAGGALA
jgi:hypothetical protein